MLQKIIVTSLLLSLSSAYPTDGSQKVKTASVEWVPCDLEFPSTTQQGIAAHGETIFCANLPVPLDYTDPGNGKTLDLQLIKVKANKEPFKGSVLTNPGGPGNSGVEWLAGSGPSIRDDIGGYHDVIGFDTR